jgi:hypothetical protein
MVSVAASAVVTPESNGDGAEHHVGGQAAHNHEDDANHPEHPASHAESMSSPPPSAPCSTLTPILTP